MTKTHIKLVSEADIEALIEERGFPYQVEDGEIEAVSYGDLLHMFNSLASAPEVGEAVADKVERNYIYEDGEEPGYDKEPAIILALRNTELQKRVEQLEDLLSSAYNIANRDGKDTHWFRFAAQLHVHGISPVTAKTFKILPSDEGYQPDRTAEQDDCEPVFWTQLTPSGKVAYFYGKPMYSTERNEIHTVPLYARKPTDRTAQIEAQLAERDEEIERLQSYEQGLNEVIAWMKERGLYHDADYFGEGADFAAILTEHEQQVSAFVERQFKADKAKLLDAIQRNQFALIVLKTMCDVAGLKAGQEKAYEMFEDNNKLLAEMEAKG